MKTTNRTKKLEKRITRGRAANLLDKTTRTLRRYEVLGLLTPIKLNCRVTMYVEREVLALANGEVKIGETHTGPTLRTALGQFAAA